MQKMEEELTEEDLVLMKKLQQKIEEDLITHRISVSYTPEEIDRQIAMGQIRPEEIDH